MGYLPIERYGVVGDLRTAALIGVNASIDFFCYPRFDSPSVFQALLDDERGGRFAITPLVENPRHRQLYLFDSNVLLSRFLAAEGVAEISDFMPIEPPGSTPQLVRRAKTVRGEVRYRLLCAPRFDHARVRHRAEITADGVVFMPDAKDLPALRLRAEVPLRVRNGDAVAEFTLGAGQSCAFILEEARQGAAPSADLGVYVSQSFKDTLNYWRRWIARSTYRGRWREMVNRSALALKLLTSREFGSIVAAPTFGLPEAVGGERNWDYRYTWIRDASFAIYALLRLGYMDEAGAFMHWIAERCEDPNPDGSLQTVYGIDGRRDLTEVALADLAGYQGSSPVRIGNDAYRQLQLDIYGELLDSVYLYDRYGVHISSVLWEALTRLIEWVCDNWRQADEGIWEVRGGAQEFCQSRVMCWVALDRALRIARNRSFPAPIGRWHDIRDEIYHSIFHEQAPDGLRGREGTFNMCSFWYVEALSRVGDIEQARLLFEKNFGYASDTGLYAEQLGRCGEHLGNFPQALTHIGLISAAYDLNRRLEAAGQGT